MNESRASVTPEMDHQNPFTRLDKIPFDSNAYRRILTATKRALKRHRKGKKPRMRYEEDADTPSPRF